MMDTNALVAALCDAIKYADPKWRFRDNDDALRTELRRVCALLDLPAPGALRAEMEWTEVRRLLVDVLAHACGRHVAYANCVLPIRSALALARAPADGRETGAGGGR
jgi:hypothetical protein